MTKSDIEFTCEFFGYESYQNYLCGNKAYEKCMNMILSLPELDIDESSFSHNKQPIKIQEMNVRNKSHKLFHDVDLNTFYMDLDTYTFYEKQGIDVLQEALNTKVDYRSIFDIPIGFDSVAHIEYPINSLLPYAPIVVSNIYLNYRNVFFEDDYIHELGHALVERKRGGKGHFVHSEFIPSFLSLLYLYENYYEDILNSRILDWLKEYYIRIIFPSSINKIIGGDPHLISGILSFEALEQYIESSSIQKKEMLERLKHCLNNHISVETFMNDYNIGFQSVEKSYKYLNKTIDRLKS